MKTVLAYGDSLTWGADPAVFGKRHPVTHRWPDVLAAGLGEGVSVVTDGLRGRTTAYDEHLADCDRNGARLLPTALYAHAPIDLVILMLGCNDMKPHICGTAIGAKQGMRRLVQIVQQHAQGLTEGVCAKALIVAPPPLVPTDDPDMSAMFDGGVEESRKLAPTYQVLADEMNTRFFNAGTVAKSSSLDGVHLDAENTKNIGIALAPIAKAMLEN